MSRVATISMSPSFSRVEFVSRFVGADGIETFIVFSSLVEVVVPVTSAAYRAALFTTFATIRVRWTFVVVVDMPFPTMWTNGVVIGFASGVAAVVSIFGCLIRYSATRRRRSEPVTSSSEVDTWTANSEVGVQPPEPTIEAEDTPRPLPAPLPAGILPTFPREDDDIPCWASPVWSSDDSSACGVEIYNGDPDDRPDHEPVSDGAGSGAEEWSATEW